MLLFYTRFYVMSDLKFSLWCCVEYYLPKCDLVYCGRNLPTFSENVLCMYHPPKRQRTGRLCSVTTKMTERFRCWTVRPKFMKLGAKVMPLEAYPIAILSYILSITISREEIDGMGLLTTLLLVSANYCYWSLLATPLLGLLTTLLLVSANYCYWCLLATLLLGSSDRSITGVY
jgi:hypothetical protein